MIRVYPVDEKGETPQHKTCYASVKGANKSSKEVVNSSFPTCNKYEHFECIPSDVQKSIADVETWFFGIERENAIKARSAECKAFKKDAQNSAGNQVIENSNQQNPELLKSVRDVRRKVAMLHVKNKVLTSKLQASAFDDLSTRAQFCDAPNYEVAHGDSLFNVKALQNIIRRSVGQLNQTMWTNSSATVDHTNSASQSSLKEIGKYSSDDQVLIKLEKVSKTSVLKHVRVWLYSPSTINITLDLEETFCHPNLTMQEALITQFNTMKGKTRKRHWNLKNSVRFFQTRLPKSPKQKGERPNYSKAASHVNGTANDATRNSTASQSSSSNNKLNSERAKAHTDIPRNSDEPSITCHPNQQNDDTLDLGLIDKYKFIEGSSDDTD